MKSRIITLLALFCTFVITAQQAINYKALIKDNIGNVLASQPVTIQFTIIQGAGATTVYQEDHNVNTDANGIAIVNIGGGNILTGDYNTINWGSDDHFLNVQIDSGSGLVDLGTTQFFAVPYALYAETSGSGTGTAPTGLEALDEGNGQGWRLIGNNAVNYGDIGLQAVDLSFSGITSATNGATGAFSLTTGASNMASGQVASALGNATIASGDYTTAMGRQTQATAMHATAMGYRAIASGNTAFAFGQDTQASGFRSTAGGYFTEATASHAFAIGDHTQATASNTAAFGFYTVADDTDATVVGRFNDPSTTNVLFQVGNGDTDVLLSNALNVFLNGTITAPSFDMALITDPKHLVTKEYVDANYIEVGSTDAPSGLEYLGDGYGWRLIGEDPDGYATIGFKSIDLSFNSTLSDNDGGATGIWSFAAGFETTASGTVSAAFGQNTISSGTNTFATGSGTIAHDSNSTVVGSYNNEAELTNVLFQVGNGTSSSKSNALNVTMDGIITAPSLDIGEITDSKTLITKEYADANYSGGGTGTSPTGLEALDEGNGQGWRLIGNNAVNYGNIGAGATDLSVANAASDTRGATGLAAFASGKITTASGQNATAMGIATIASGDDSTAMGRETQATTVHATAMGYRAIASGNTAFAFGQDTQASGFRSAAGGYFTEATANHAFAIGDHTQATASNTAAFGFYTVADDTDATVVGRFNDPATTNVLFQVGNGDTDVLLSNALNVFYNGTITAPSFDISEITDPKALITKEYADANYSGGGSGTTPTGLEAIDEGNGTGWRLIGADPVNYGNIGNGAVDFSYYDFSSSTKGATGTRSIAVGDGVEASGYASVAMGIATEASGSYSVAMGYFSGAIGDYSVAMNYSNADAFYSSAFGYNNIGGGSPSGWVDSDPLFEIGNGVNDDFNVPSNALTILKNGYTTVGTHEVLPTTDFQINHDNDGTLNGLKLQNKGANENWWRFYTLNSNGQLYLYSKAGGNASPVGSFDDASGAYTALSDRRAKANFKDLYFNWQEFMQLQPLTYHYKTDENKKSHIGFVAQDVEPIYPELVNHNKEDDLYQLNYSGFGVVAIKAIQQLKKENEQLKKENEQLKALLLKNEEAIAEQSHVLQALLERVEVLEQQSTSVPVELVKN